MIDPLFTNKDIKRQFRVICKTIDFKEFIIKNIANNNVQFWLLQEFLSHTNGINLRYFEVEMTEESVFPFPQLSEESDSVTYYPRAVRKRPDTSHNLSQESLETDNDKNDRSSLGNTDGIENTADSGNNGEASESDTGNTNNGSGTENNIGDSANGNNANGSNSGNMGDDGRNPGNSGNRNGNGDGLGNNRNIKSKRENTDEDQEDSASKPGEQVMPMDIATNQPLEDPAEMVWQVLPRNLICPPLKWVSSPYNEDIQLALILSYTQTKPSRPVTLAEVNACFISKPIKTLLARPASLILKKIKIRKKTKNCADSQRRVSKEDVMISLGLRRITQEHTYREVSTEMDTESAIVDIGTETNDGPDDAVLDPGAQPRGNSLEPAPNFESYQRTNILPAVPQSGEPMNTEKTATESSKDNASPMDIDNTEKTKVNTEKPVEPIKLLDPNARYLSKLYTRDRVVNLDTYDQTQGPSGLRPRKRNPILALRNLAPHPHQSNLLIYLDVIPDPTKEHRVSRSQRWLTPGYTGPPDPSLFDDSDSDSQPATDLPKRSKDNQSKRKYSDEE